MDSNIIDDDFLFNIINQIMAKRTAKRDFKSVFKELLTKSEIETLSKRWRIMQMLAVGKTQREIANELNVSLCKVTRGSKILKDRNSILAKFLLKEKI
ncbi:MAG: trp operon repressor [bacterium]|nr:trp operon repressor [bacterium]